MKNYQTDILINAPAEKVWQVLMDHEKYADWNPFIKRVDGNKNAGGKLSVSLQMEGSKEMNMAPKVLKNNGSSEFRWLGHLLVKGLFDGEHYFILEPVSPTETRFVHGENFSGLLCKLVLKMVGEKTIQGFNAMNVALKSRVESSL